MSCLRGGHGGIISKRVSWVAVLDEHSQILSSVRVSLNRGKELAVSLSFRNGMNFGRFFFSGSPLFSPKFACDTILATFNFGHIFLPPVSGHLFTYVHRFFTPPPLSQEDVAPHGNSRHSRLEIPLFHYVDRTKEKPARW